MNYEQTLKFMYSQLPAYHRIGKAAYKNNLENSVALDEYLGKPHLLYPSIHIAGTNGKGSVSHMITSVLMEAGLKTGLYTSPHLKDYRERIKVNGKMIPKSCVTEFISTHSEKLESMKPSFFEMTVALAFDYFADEGVDIAVIETGLGGRLDSTNIINPVLSIITNIGHDHIDILGDTPGKIAYEKAGIIKKGIPVVIGETTEETMNVFINRARESGSEIFFADQNFTCKMKDSSYVSGKRDYELHELRSGRVYIGKSGLEGDYQSKNIQTVFQSLSILHRIIEFNDEAVSAGIRKVVENTGLLGRWQVKGRNPLIVCDTGHNKEGIEYVVSQIKRIKKTKLHMVVGFVNDKDLGSILPLLPVDAAYYFTKASVERALDEKVLSESASAFGLKGSCYPDVCSAVKAARSDASATDMIFIGGSTFIVADALMC